MRLAAILLCAAAATGCTDVCDEAICQLREECDRVVERPEDAECLGEQKAFSQCIVDHTREACAWYDDPVAHDGNAFHRCTAPTE